MSKTSKFVPLCGAIVGGILIFVDAYDTIEFTLDSSSFWAYMAFTVGGSSAYGILKHWKKQ